MPKRVAHWLVRHQQGFFTLLSVTCLVMTSISLFVLISVVKKNNTARKVQCIERYALEHEIEQTNELLDKFPKQDAIFRIPRTLWERSLQDKDEQLRLQRGLECDDVPRPEFSRDNNLLP